MKRYIKYILAAFLVVSSTNAFAEGDKIEVALKSKLAVHGDGSDYRYKCDFLRLQIKGTFANDFSYVFRQRLNKPVTDGDFMNATDYLYLKWRKNNWEVGGGKYYIACGGFEYNSSTYDLHISPEFFNGLGGMYNYIANVSYHTHGERICLEVSNSLYSAKVSELLGYSLNVSGQKGCWEHNYSVNFFEREKGLFNQFFCLGNSFHFGPVTWNLDLDHRIDMNKVEWFKNMSVVTKAKVHATETLDVFGKITWDYNDGVDDPILAIGTKVTKAGVGIELYPVKEYRNLRFHCVYYNVNGKNNCLNAGLSWMLDIYKK